MTQHKRLVENIQTKMAFYVSNLRISNDRDYYDENKEAEYFFCKPLSLLFDADVTNANTEQRNFPGIDLADKKESICFQITSTNTKKKVQHTLDEFLAHNLDNDFERLIVLIVTLDTPPKCANLRFDRPFDFDVKRDVWNISRLVQEFAALPDDQGHLLRAFSDYLDQELPNIEVQKPHLALPLHSALQPADFVGREDELARIRSRFVRGNQLVVLTGLGGMGKTELAVQYGRTHGRTVYFAHFDGTFTRTLARMAEGIRPALSEEQLRQEDTVLRDMVLKLLEEADQNDLLIIDNADSPTGDLSALQKDPAWQALCRLPLKLLLTTRSAAPRTIPVGAMARETLFDIFRKHGANLEQQEMEALIDAVNGHTLTVDLIARTLNGGGLRKVTAAMMLKALRENTLPTEKYKKIATDYHQSTEQAQIYQHLSTVFDVSAMSDGEKRLLGIATLFPESGIDGDLIADIVTEEQAELYEALVSRGWLEIRNDLLTIHPIIRLVCRTEIPPTDESCHDFLNGLIKQYDENHYDKDRYRQMAELLTNASHDLEDANGNRAGWATALWHALGNYGQALDCILRVMGKQETTLPSDHPNLALAYNNVGIAYSDLGNHNKALDYKLKALAIREKALPPDHPDLALSYNNVGYTYGELGNHRKELEYQLKALSIREKALPPEHPDLALSYNNVGSTYGELGDHRKDLEYQLKALSIREKALPPDHPDLAVSYSNVGTAYGDLGDHRKDLEYQLKALAIRKKALPPEHPDLAQSYNNVGLTYSDLGDHRKALDYLLKALAIWEKTLPPKHPDLAVFYNNAGYIYGQLGGHRKDLEYQLKALAIWEKALPSDHPNLAQSCNNVAWTYYEIGQLQDAARYMRRAADIISRSALPEDHPKRVNFPKWAEEIEMEANMQQP